MEGNKRKRDSSDDISRSAQITFHADTRAFERLFKERSLGELKLAVRRKLGLADGTFVKLKQMRFDTLIDLDDDDDFEALRVHASRTLLPIDIKVIVQQGTSQVGSDPHTNSTSAVVDLPRPSTLAAVPSELASKKRKVAIEDSVTSETAVPTTPAQSQLAREATKAKGRKRKVKAGDADVSAATTSDPTKGVEKASADTGPTSQEKGVGPPKKKQKRAKDVVPPQTGETSEMGELPSVGPSSIPKVSQSRDIGPEKEKVAIRDLAAGNQDKVIPLATKKQKSSKTSKQKDPLGKQVG
ncbi:hypothetical protein ID866_4147 [Astraeus odoratus]|nr:hypothetical protein ID866_4147 [Astraeus odoratus]